jgi:hypothetical protein
MRVWSGLQAPSERLVISKFGALISSTHLDCVVHDFSRTIERQHHKPLIILVAGVILSISYPFLSLQQRSTSIRGAMVALVR